MKFSKTGFIIIIFIFPLIFAAIISNNILPHEDASILFEYSKTFKEKFLISYGGSNYPIEGATDFLWMILISILSLFSGASEYQISIFLTFLSLVLMILIFNENLKKNNGSAVNLFLIFGSILINPYLYSAIAGFSTILFSVFLILTIKYLDSPRTFWIFSLTSCLIRPDGIVWVFSLIFYKLFIRSSISKAKIKNFLIYYLAPSLIYFLLRFSYFDNFFPLPFYVKTGAERDLFFFYQRSINDGLLIILPLIVIIFSIREIYFKKILFFYFLIPVIFYFLINLEQNFGNRFFAPIFFVTIYFLSLFKKWKLLKVFLILSTLFSLPLTKNTILNTFSNTFNSNPLYNLARNLDNQKTKKILTTEAGIITYYSNFNVEDAWGLNTPIYSKKNISQKDLRNKNYDLIVANCSQYLDDEILNLSNQLKSWSTMCRNIVKFVNNNNKYEIFLIPKKIRDYESFYERFRRFYHINLNKNINYNQNKNWCKTIFVAVKFELDDFDEIKKTINNYYGVSVKKKDELENISKNLYCF